MIMKKFISSFLIIVALPMLTIGQIIDTPINFDDGQNMNLLKIDTSIPSNIWQIGKPQKSFFNQAYSTPNVIVTDTINPYPVNNLSKFYIYIPTDTTNPEIFGQEMSFYYKIFTDTLSDFGNIEYSFNKGLTWHNLVPGPDSLNLYWVVEQVDPWLQLYGSWDTLNPFTGKSSGWYYFSMTYNWPNFIFLPPTDTVYYRFTFHSDGIQTNKDGWMVDNFMIGDLIEGIGENSITNGLSVVPNPCQNEFTLTILENNQNPNEPFTYEIFSAQGDKIIDGKFHGKTTKIEELGNSAPGLYFLRVKKDSKFFCLKKIVKI
jgi:hypothetical protein